MTKIDIDDIDAEYSDEGIHLAIKMFIRPDYIYKTDTGYTFNTYDKLMTIAFLIGKIKGENLLKNTIELVNLAGYLTTAIIGNLVFENAANIKDYYSYDNKVRISALYFSHTFQHELLTRKYVEVFASGLPELIITVEDRVFKSNLDPIFDILRKTLVKFAVNFVALESKTVQKNHLKELIKRFAESDYTNDTDSYSSEIRYLQTLKENLTEQETISQLTSSHDHIFSNNGFVLFEHLMQKYVKQKWGRNADLNFFYRKMSENNPPYIHQLPTKFFEWYAFQYNEEAPQVITKSQSKSHQRERDFTTALDWFKSQNE